MIDYLKKAGLLGGSRFFTLCLALVLCILPFTARTDDDIFGEDGEICAAIVEFHKTQGKPSFKKRMSAAYKLLLLKFHPKTYAHPMIDSFATPAFNNEQNFSARQGRLKNIIYTFGPTEQDLERAVLQRELPRFLVEQSHHLARPIFGLKRKTGRTKRQAG